MNSVFFAEAHACGQDREQPFQAQLSSAREDHLGYEQGEHVYARHRGMVGVQRAHPILSQPAGGETGAVRD